MSMRRVAKTVSLVVGGILVLVLVALVVVGTPWFREWARGQAELAGSSALQGSLTIGRLGGNLLTGVDLENVAIRTDQGEVIAADRIEVDYSIANLLRGDVVLNDVRLVRPAVKLIETPDGWNLARLAKPREPGTEPGSRRVSIDDLEIEDGRVAIEPLRDTAGGVRIPSAVHDLSADLSFDYAAGQLALAADSMSFKAVNPSLEVQRLSGTVRHTDKGWRFDELAIETPESRIRVDGRYESAAEPVSLDLDVQTDPVSFAELSGIVPALGEHPLTPSIDANVQGPLGELHTEVRAADPQAGSVDANLVLDVAGPEQGVRGSLTTRDLDGAAITGEPRWATSISANVHVDLETDNGWSLGSLRGDWGVDANDVKALEYRAERVEASGRLHDGTLEADGTVEAYGATATTDATVAVTAEPVSYRAAGRVESLDVRALPAVLGAPRLDSRVDARYSVQGSGPRVSGSLDFSRSTIEGASIGAGATARFSLGGAEPGYAFTGDVAHLDLERIGRALRIEALAAPRFASDLTGHVDVEGSGASATALDLRAEGRLESSTLLHANVPSLSFDASLSGERLRVTTQGRIENLDLGQVGTGDRLAGTVTAAFDVSATVDPITGPIDADAVRASGRATIEPSTVNDLQIDRAEIVADYAGRVAHVMTLDVEGPNIALTASGPLSLADGTSSAFDFTVDVGSLDAFSSLVGHELAGGAHVEGQVTGDRARLVTAGPIRLTQFAYDDLVDALTAEGQYSVALPNLDVSNLSVQTDLESTLLTLEGQELTSASFRVGYTQPELTFDATLRDGQRTAMASGRLVLHTGHQEIHVERLSIGTGEVTWSNPSGRTLDIDYGEGLVSLDHLALVSGMQRIAADGTLAIAEGRHGSLDVQVENVDLAELAELLLLDRQLAGRLDATATVTGGLDSRKVDSHLTVRNGVADQFAFDSLEASVDYTPPRARVEAMLVQQPGATLDITGAVPVGGDGQLDLHVTSTPIDLAVVGAATTALQQVAGTLDVNVDVTGTLQAPLVHGDVNIANGAFTVAPSGVAYQDVQARVRFDGASASVERLRLQDDDGHPLTVNGAFGVVGRQIRDIQVTARADDLKVLNNEFGDVSINTDVALDGTLGSPQVTGRIRIDSGRIDVAALLERLTSNPYETESAAARAAAAERASPGPYENLGMNLTVDVPDNLVLRGNGIQAGGGPALGDLNVTVGGTIRLLKDPGGELRVLGTVQTVRGAYQFQGRQFAVLRNGTIEFRGGDTIDPALDLTTERDVSGVAVRVAIQGTARQPQLALSSDPPMSETDILSLIVFNQPANQLGEGQRASLGERAAALASGAVIGALSESLEQALNLTVFEVQTASEAGGAPMVTIGKQVTEDLFIRLRQLFGAQQVSRLMIEYELNSFLRLQGEVSDGQTLANRSLTRRVERGGIDLVLYLRY